MIRTAAHGWMAAAFGLALGMAAAAPALGHDGTAHGEAKPAPGGAADASAEVRLHDLELTDETGKPVRFVTDAVAGQVVAIDFVYTTCTTVCPVLSSVFAIVQEELGDRAGTEVRLISISIDPVRDTPRRLAEYARAFDAGEGWMWLTGEKSKVDRVLTGLGAYSPTIEDHPPMLLVGDSERGVWRRLFGFQTPEAILQQIDELVGQRQHSEKTSSLGE